MGDRGRKTKTKTQTGEDLGASLRGVDYQQTGTLVWLKLQGSLCLSTDRKLKFQHCMRCWFMLLERRRTALQYSPYSSTRSAVKSLHKCQLDRCNPLQGPDNMSATTLASKELQNSMTSKGFENNSNNNNTYIQ